MVYLVQLLCPGRHCIVGMAYEEENHTFEQIKAELEGKFKRMGLNRWCGICGSPKLEYENRQTPFATLAEAAGPIASAILNQIITRQVLDEKGLTYDQARKN